MKAVIAISLVVDGLEGQIDGVHTPESCLSRRVDPNFYEPKCSTLYGNSVDRREWFLHKSKQERLLGSIA